MATQDRRSFLVRWGDAATAGLLALGTFVLLLATLNDYGMAWDEGFTVEREDRLHEWFARLAAGKSPVPRAWSPFLSNLEPRADYLRRAGPAADSAWSRDSLRFYWQFAREEPNGHPPFYALLGLAGWSVSRHVLAPPGAYRFGPALLFALTTGALYGIMARYYGRLAGLTAGLGLLTMPRAFAHAHLASYDAPTLCLWFLAVAAFLRAVEPTETGRRPWAWALAFGVAWGCAAATKFTGWFVPVPLVAWALLYRDRRAAVTLVLGAVIAALLFYALNPTWWADPYQSVRVFLDSNLTREKRSPIPTVFFGRLYPFALPWYNTLVLTAIVVPPATLALALAGIGRAVVACRRDRAGTLLLGCWAFFIVLRALPSAPGHDGERQFLTAFVFLAALSGVGLAAIRDGLGRVSSPKAARALAGAVLLGATGAGAWSTWRYHPLQLSYYNAFIGGLSGATRAGLEPTYYWEALTPDVRDWLNAHTAKGRSVAFAFPTVTFEYLRHWGLLRPSPLPSVGRPPQWYVVMNRPGHLRYGAESVAQYLLDHARPAFVKTAGAAPDVPLIAIYSAEDAFAAESLLNRPGPNGSAP